VTSRSTRRVPRFTSLPSSTSPTMATSKDQKAKVCFKVLSLLFVSHHKLTPTNQLPAQCPALHHRGFLRRSSGDWLVVAHPHTPQGRVPKLISTFFSAITYPAECMIPTLSKFSPYSSFYLRLIFHPSLVAKTRTQLNRRLAEGQKLPWPPFGKQWYAGCTTLIIGNSLKAGIREFVVGVEVCWCWCWSDQG